MSTRPSRSALLAVLLAAGIVAIAPVSAASAHDPVTTSVPANGAVLTEIPATFSVTAAQPMLDLSGDAAGFGLQVTDADGLYYGDGCITVAGDTLSMPATLGEPGDYTMTYQYVSSDGHMTSDTIDFSLASTATTPAQVGSVAPPVCGEEPGLDDSTAEPSPTATEAAPDEAEPPVDTPADESAVVLGIVAAITAGLAALVAVIAVAVRRGRTAEADESAIESDSADDTGTRGDAAGSS